MFVLTCFLILPSLVHSGCHFQGVEDFDYDTDDYRLRCVPELSEHHIAKPSTVCVVTCKHNSLRFKHRCNRDQKWDMDPDLTRCQKVQKCEDPKKKWPRWNFK